MIKPYTAEHASISSTEMRAARKAADADVKAAEAILIAARDRRDTLKLEAFRRKQAKRIDAVIGTIKASPDLRASLEALRNSRTARTFAPMGHDHPALPAWRVIAGPGHWQNDTGRRMIEIVLALIPANAA